MKGILITLKKRSQTFPGEFKDNYDYTIFGHYDSMDVDYIEHMGQFRPANVADIRASSSDTAEIIKEKIQDGVFDKYTIKAFYTSSSDKNGNIDYTIWKNKGVEKEYPLISCIMIHLSKKCIKNNPLKSILGEITSVINGSIKDVKCGVYFSIGYSDIIILVRSKDFDKTNEIIRELYSLKESGQKSKQKKETNWISALYTITGFHREAFWSQNNVENGIGQAYTDWKADKKMSFCVALKLKDQVLTDKFIKGLDRRMKSIFRKIGYKYTEKDLKKCIHVTFGNIDIIFIIELPIAVFSALYCAELGGIFSQKSNFFKEYIAGVKVSVLNDTSIISPPVVHGSGGNYFRERDLIEFLIEFKNVTCDQNLPRRLIESIIPIAKLYKTLVKHPHGFELSYIMKKAMDSFMNNMRIAFEDLAQTNGMKRGELIKNIEKSTGDFRVYITTYLNDLHRSERSFIEGKTMTHPSIGALTKLLFAYNKYIDELANENNENNSKYSFVLVSGGCDQTQVQVIFNFLGSWREKYQRLFIVSIPEISLFDIQGTLFRLAHECFHFFGKRKRKERKYYAMLAWSCYIAERISEKLFNPKIYKLEEIESIVSDKNAIMSKRMKMQKDFCKSFEIEMEKEIKRIVVDDKNEIGEDFEKNFYSNNCAEMIKKDLGILFVMASEIDNPFYENIVKIFLKNQIEVYKTILEQTTIWNENIAALTDEISEMEYYINNHTKLNDMNFILVNMLRNLLSSIIESKRIILADSMVQMAYYINNCDGVNRKELEEIDSDLCLSLENFPNTIVNVMCECFADCSAVHTLGVSFAEFIFAFTYETRDVTKAMPLSTSNVLRIGIDLEYLFDVTGSLTDERKNCIREIYREYDNAKFSISVDTNDTDKACVDVDKYIDILNDLLQKYQKVKSVGDCVIDYLELCLKNKKGKDNQFKALYSVFKDPDTFSNNHIYDILEWWKKLAEG